ncbi:MAG: OPT/YSL family transporter, partial [Negativicutes bacterium]|nr:OPT/YSL family transporter [Negativicutes bacterium]
MTGGEEKKLALPDNAFRELKEGEKYVPIMTDGDSPREDTPYAVILGFLFGAVFTVAASYMPLKIGQGVTSDTPIAAIAVGLAALLARKHALGENMMMQCTGSTGSMVNSGVIFVIPAMFILNLPVTWLDIVWTVIIGGFLGIFYAIILRDYFVVHMHGRYPFPGSVATTEILVSGGNSGSAGLKILLSSAVYGGILDFCTNTFAWWNEVFTTRVTGWGKWLADKHKMLLSIDAEASVVAIGYLTGFRYALIIACGSFFGWLFIIPLISYFAPGLTAPVGNVAKTVGQMSPEEIFRNYVRYIGIGALAMSGIIGVIKMGRY